MSISDDGSEHLLLSDQTSMHSMSPDIQNSGDASNDVLQSLEPLSLPLHMDEGIDATSDLDSEQSPEDAADQIRRRDKNKGKAIEGQDYHLNEDLELLKNRPNKFIGPDITWRRWTQHERLTSHSIDEVRHRDLGIHLFNAHALHLRKRQAMLRESHGIVVEPNEMFVPHKSWTSWPLPSSAVPRGTMNPVFDGDDPTTVRNYHDPSSSDELEECLIALALRQAKSRFKERPLADAADDKTTAKQEIAKPPSPDVARASVVDAAPVFSTQEIRRFEEEEDDDDLPQRQNSTGRQQSSLYETEGSKVPVFLADDERCRELLLPSTKETMAHFDALLEGLHRARVAYGSRTDHSLDYDEGEGINSHYWRRRRRVSRGKRGQSRAGEMTDQEHSDAYLGRSRQRKAATRRTQSPVSRDWSDILAIAALVGWDKEVIDRTAKRCADLFDEDMEFMTLHEDPAREEPSATSQASASGENVGNVSDPQVARGLDKDTTVEMNGVEEGPYGCPNRFCRQQGRSFTSINGLSEHLQRHHSLSPALSRSRRPSEVDMPVQEIGSETLKRWFCPLKTCRGQVKGYARSTNLYDHVQKLHPEIDVAEITEMAKKLREGLRTSRTDRKRNRRPQTVREESYESLSSSQE